MIALTKQEMELFEVIDNASNLCLIRGFLKGKPVGVVALHTEKDEEVIMHPLALLLDDELREQLKPDDNEYIEG